MLTNSHPNNGTIIIPRRELAEFKQQNRQLKSQVSQLEMRINALLQSR